MKKKWDVCGNVRDGYTVCWGDAIVYYLNVVCMLFVSFSNFGGDGCAGTDTLGTDAVSGTTLGSIAGWFVTTVDCVVNYYGNVG